MLIALCLDLLADGRADVDADAAARAVVGGDLDRHEVAGKVRGRSRAARGKPAGAPARAEGS